MAVSPRSRPPGTSSRQSWPPRQRPAILGQDEPSVASMLWAVCGEPPRCSHFVLIPVLFTASSLLANLKWSGGAWPCRSHGGEMRQLLPLLRRQYPYLAKDLIAAFLEALNVGRTTC